MHVEAREGNLHGLTDIELIGKGGADTALVIACDLAASDLVETCSRCRRLGLPIISGTSFGFWGFLFQDAGASRSYLPSHSSSPSVNGATGESVVEFHAMEEILTSAVYSSLPPKYTQPIVFAWLALHACARNTGRPSSSSSTTEDVLFATAEALGKGKVSSAVCSELLQNIGVEISPVAAILGSMVANEAVKIVTGKDAPLNNFLAFDGMNGSGGRLYKL